MEYNFREIEKKWQKYWEENKTFKTDIKDFKIWISTHSGPLL